MRLGPIKIDVDVRVRGDREILEQIREIVMATQAQVDALTERVNTGVTNIRQDIADIKAAHPEIDLTALEASVGGLEGLDQENPVTPPVEPTDPDNPNA